MRLISLNIGYYPMWEQQVCNLIEAILREKAALHDAAARAVVPKA